MGKNEDRSNNLKKYTRELREQVQNYNILSKKGIRSLQTKFHLSKDDIKRIEDLAVENCLKAKQLYLDGDWDNAIKTIEEGMNKSPLNRKIIEQHIIILYEKNKIFSTENDDESMIQLLLKRLFRVDKLLFLRLKNRYRNIKKIKKKTLLMLLIPLFILILLPILYFASINKGKDNNEISPPPRVVANGEIFVEFDNHIFNDMKLEVLKSVMSRSKDNFLYNLQFSLSSEDYNIKQITGYIEWYDNKKNLIYSEEFQTDTNVEYFLHEQITYNYTKTSLRQSPNLFFVSIKLQDVEQVDGKERTDLKLITLDLESKTNLVDFYEYSIEIIQGVISNYISTVIIVHNRSDKSIKNLIGQLVWLDNNDMELHSNYMNFIDSEDVPLKSKERRTLFNIIEIENDITPNYRIVIIP